MSQFFLGECPKFPFLTTWPQKRAPPKHNKIGVSAIFWKWKKHMRHEKAILGPNKPNPEIPVMIFLGSFFSLDNKNTKNAETPIL